MNMGKVTVLPNRADEQQRYVRVTNPDHRGFVEFQFSIGDPSLYLEMTLPSAAFLEFCQEHRVRHLSAAEAAAVDDNERRWRHGDYSDEDSE